MFSGLNIADWGRGFAAIALQILIFQHLTIFSIQADIVLAYLVWAAANRNRNSVVLLAALLGFTFDALMDTWGVHMFTKTLTVFVVFNFVPKENENKLGWMEVSTTVLVVALLHQALLLTLVNFAELYTHAGHFWKILIGSSIYTGLTAGFFNLFRNY